MLSLPGICIRPAQTGDLEQVARLGRLAFSPLSSDGDIATTWYGNGLELPGRTIFLATDGTGEAVASYTQMALRLYFLGKSLPALGIAGVAVAPHRRGQKLAQLLLEHALQTAQSQNIGLVMLYPFQQGFYRRLGWAWVGRSHQYPVLSRHLPLFPERHQVGPCVAEHQALLKSLYQQVAPQHNGWLDRQEFHWQSWLNPKPGREIYGYWENGLLLGYVVLQFTQVEQELAVVVQEWIALSALAYRGIIGFLASLRDQVQTVVWNTSGDDPFPYLLQEQRTHTEPSFRFGFTKPFGTIRSGFMWRLVDLDTAFRLRPIALGPAFCLTFEVSDPILGHRSCSVNFTDGQMHPSQQQSPNRLQLSINHLTELLSGLRRPTELLWSGEITYTGELELLPQLDRAWQANPPFCWDFF